MRNVLIGLGNSGARDRVAVVEARLTDPSPLVRAMAVWALRRLALADRFTALRAQIRPGEADPAVREEWDDGAEAE